MTLRLLAALTILKIAKQKTKLALNNRSLALGKAASNQSTADSCSVQSMHDIFDESCSPPPSWKNVDMDSSVINLLSQCPMGDLSSFPVPETEDFLIPSSASVVEGLGAGISGVGRSTSTRAKAKAKAIAAVDKKLNELFKCSTFSVS